MPLDRGIGRQIDAGLGSAAVADPDDRVEEADPFDEYQPLPLGLAVDIRPNRHMVGVRLKDDRGGQRVGSALPQPCRARIARAGGHIGAQCGRKQQRVAIEPSGPALRLGQGETAGYEVARGKIELAQHHRIGAAARQHQNGAVVAPRHRRSPAPYPILVFSCRERIEIEQKLPFRLHGSEAVERGGAPQPTGVRGILPEIEDSGAAPGNYWDIVGAVIDRREHVAIGCETGIAEPRQGRRVLRLDPGERPFTIDLFEPQIRVVVGGFDGRARIGHGSVRRLNQHRFKINTVPKMGNSRGILSKSRRTGHLATQKVVDIHRQAGEINQIRVEPPRSSLVARRGSVWGICYRWAKVP